MSQLSSRVIAQEIQAMNGHLYDPTYITAVRNGSRVVRSLSALIAEAESRLAAKAEKPARGRK